MRMDLLPRRLEHCKYDVEKVLEVNARFLNFAETQRYLLDRGLLVKYYNIRNWFINYDSDYNAGTGWWEGDGRLTFRFNREKCEWESFRKLNG